MSVSRTIILDRDGVINEDSDAFVKSPDEWIPIEGSLEAIARLTQAAYRVIVATNQSGVARGLFDLATLNAIHQKMQQAVTRHGGELAAIYVCPHGPDDHCNCRKPKPGLLLQAQQDFALDFADCLAVGDSLRDIQAAGAVNCPAYLVKTGKGQRMLAKHPEQLQFVQKFNNLKELVDALME